MVPAAFAAANVATSVYSGWMGLGDPRVNAGLALCILAWPVPIIYPYTLRYWDGLCIPDSEIANLDRNILSFRPRDCADVYNCLRPIV